MKRKKSVSSSVTNGTRNLILLSKNGKMKLKDSVTNKILPMEYQSLVMFADDKSILSATMIDKKGVKIELGAIVFL
jgi:hypothetical protein